MLRRTYCVGEIGGLLRSLSARVPLCSGTLNCGSDEAVSASLLDVEICKSIFHELERGNFVSYWARYLAFWCHASLGSNNDDGFLNLGYY